VHCGRQNDIAQEAGQCNIKSEECQAAGEEFYRRDSYGAGEAPQRTIFEKMKIGVPVEANMVIKKAGVLVICLIIGEFRLKIV
jgi:hypothetical protein